MVICLERGASDLHMVQLMPLPPHHVLLQQNAECLSFWYRPTQVVLEERLLNGCVCVCVSAYVHEHKFSPSSSRKLLQK